jgi:uncharacterized damage-inducible protein DinB
MVMLLAVMSGAGVWGQEERLEGLWQGFDGEWGHVSRQLVALAEAMPADKYGWSPGPGVMPVAKVFAHVARYNYLYPETSLGTPAPDGRAADAAEDLTDKAQLVARLRESGDHVRLVVRGLADPSRVTEQYGRAVPQWSVLLQLVAHMNEHLGQVIAYARMNGVVPPWSR